MPVPWIRNGCILQRLPSLGEEELSSNGARRHLRALQRKAAIFDVEDLRGFDNGDGWVIFRVVEGDVLLYTMVNHGKSPSFTTSWEKMFWNFFQASNKQILVFFSEDS